MQDWDIYYIMHIYKYIIHVVHEMLIICGIYIYIVIVFMSLYLHIIHISYHIISHAT